MVKVITYGTYDLLHHGHIRLLERAKALGDYLIVGVTADDFDISRGKINVQQPLIERIEAVRQTGLADEIIVEEYEGQKIDDIRRYEVDIFTVGSDWTGKFDYLREYCQVIYLPRTEGISSSGIRHDRRETSMGLVGSSAYLNKVARESAYVNGIRLSGLCTDDVSQLAEEVRSLPLVTDDYQRLLDVSDAVFIYSQPQLHFAQIQAALTRGKHVFCESPLALSERECRQLYALAQEKGCILAESLRTAYSMAYHRLQLLVKSGRIGDVVSVDATCTSLLDASKLTEKQRANLWNTISEWGPTAMLPVFQILGTQYADIQIVSHIVRERPLYDTFTKISFLYPHAVASIKVGSGVKSEGELVVSGTRGYIYVPAPWWKMDYFEVRYENPAENKRCFYQLDGEGIRYALANFLKMIQTGKPSLYISQDVSAAICGVMEAYGRGEHLVRI